MHGASVIEERLIRHEEAVVVDEVDKVSVVEEVWADSIVVDSGIDGCIGADGQESSGKAGGKSGILSWEEASKG